MVSQTSLDQNSAPSDLNPVAADPLAQYSAEERRQLLLRLVDSFGGKKVFVNLVVFNFFLLYVRPQDIIPGLGVLKLPIIFLSITGVAWLLKRSCGNWTYQIKMLLIFLAVEGFRGFIGKVVIEDFVRNDFVMFTTWRDLLTIFTGISFSMIAFLDHGPALRRLMKCVTVTSLLLGLYAVTHHGRGPGAFLGDENDLGCGLLMLLAFTLALLTEGGRNAGSKILLILSSIINFGGILATFSRGTFVGLVAMCAIFLLRSRKKLLLISSFVFVVLFAVPFAPPGYIEEMYTIKQTNTGTADIRKHYWKLARRCFFDPAHTLTGVGIRNTVYWMGDYETPEDLAKYPSASGRATHSVYFELLPDLGLWGIFVVGSLLFVSAKTNLRAGRDIQQIARQAKGVVAAIGKANQDSAEAGMTGEHDWEASQQRRGEAVRLARRIETEAQYLTALTTGTNVSLVGVLGSGAFIDILYYPHLWILFGLSGLLGIYSQRLIRISKAVLADVNPIQSQQPKID